MILPERAPATNAAMTKSSWRRLSSLLRTTRARPVQPISDTITVIPKYTRMVGQLAGSAAARAIHTGSTGSDRRKSMLRCTMASAKPPKYPETPPMERPRMKLRATPISPIDSEMRVPYMMRLNTSRPRMSVPSRNR